MDLKRIDTLLARYYEGASTLEEEAELKQFFAGNNVPERLQAEQLLFRMMDKEREIGTNKSYLEPAALGAESPEGGKVISIKRVTRFISYAAASVLLLLGAAWLFNE